MNEKEVRLRTFFIFVKSTELFEAVQKELVTLLEGQAQVNEHRLNHAMRREGGILFRYWSTRFLWDALSDDDETAKQLNLRLLRLFSENFDFPRDGSGLLYAELSTPFDEAREFIRRLNKQLDIEDLETLREFVQKEFLGWREQILAVTQEAIEADLEVLETAASGWVQRDADQS